MQAVQRLQNGPHLRQVGREARFDGVFKATKVSMLENAAKTNPNVSVCARWRLFGVSTSSKAPPTTAARMAGQHQAPTSPGSETKASSPVLMPELR
eukprot:CAMPEP_0197699032 /NCGR_PEP_ID=MMETSP1338-20131121/120085_1 /TAXON_ID=43686 ORGANISM="Pelagodinium beii, Strain RCC1491" /NCGR_SAMPLE_ID=MMETSP1338 /ASSEMBLY_ACC=CAM_ASM_000754 /LENGTH=95 /DNA_ID=CAMNT_0043282481 /DNA_START=175 /DNA_END=462 /DNA_ORIENTATION=-